ncbi:AcrR family transcriptional regulator [Actinoplanes octamycinicus]|uniref:AcrR family transcriptional regulator n=1 Tax=Actinoplanes octamycinicus TaxID=135948 RepID=A0A7W7MAT6_9ACTN|nr:TetR/AcrR family transcriptional regulator [Actinoplanes octamycinicus]MBB4743388.1 AcrR family transcriptional regulator [Actinoplanes octamycinicus]
MGRSRTNPAPGAPVTARGRRTRDALVAAGRRLLETRGWPAFTPEQVAQAAGVSYGTFYTYFESKDDLLRTIVRAVAEEMFTASLVGPETADDPYTRIVESNRGYLRAWRNASRVLRLVEQGADSDDTLRQLLLEVRELYVQRGAEGLRRLQEAGLADRELEPRLTAIVLGAMVEQMAHVIYSLREPLDEDAVVNHMSKLWAAAIGLRERP